MRVFAVGFGCCRYTHINADHAAWLVVCVVYAMCVCLRALYVYVDWSAPHMHKVYIVRSRFTYDRVNGTQHAI